MSEIINWKLNTEYSVKIVMATIAGVPVTNAVAADFVTKVTYDSVNYTIPVSIIELDSTNLPGWYKIAFTPDLVGRWRVVITHSIHNPFGWGKNLQVYVNDFVDTLADGVDLFKAMTKLDTSTAPWSLCLIKAGTGTQGNGFLDGTILRRVYLYRPSGLGITTATSVAGSQLDN
jgi:hypothetical protein